MEVGRIRSSPRTCAWGKPSGGRSMGPACRAQSNREATDASRLCAIGDARRRCRGGRRAQFTTHLEAGFLRRCRFPPGTHARKTRPADALVELLQAALIGNVVIVADFH